MSATQASPDVSIIVQAMIASVTKEDLAVATGSMCRIFVHPVDLLTYSQLVTYLFRTTGQVIGVSLSGAVLQAVLLKNLRQRITGPGSEQIIEAVR